MGGLWAFASCDFDTLWKVINATNAGRTAEIIDSAEVIRVVHLCRLALLAGTPRTGRIAALGCRPGAITPITRPRWTKNDRATSATVVFSMMP